MNHINFVSVWLGFLVFIIWLIIVIFAAYKSGHHTVSPSKKWGLFFWFITFFPVVMIFLLINSKNGLWGYYLIAFIAPFLIRYFYSVPTMVKKREELNLKFKSLSFTNKEPRFSLSPSQATVIFNGDNESYIDWIWPCTSLNRVCKNTYGEYFWVHQQVSYGEINIKHLTVEAAKNLMRSDREAFINEFGVEPYA